MGLWLAPQSLVLGFQPQPGLSLHPRNGTAQLLRVWTVGSDFLVQTPPQPVTNRDHGLVFELPCAALFLFVCGVGMKPGAGGRPD